MGTGLQTKFFSFWGQVSERNFFRFGDRSHSEIFFALGTHLTTTSEWQTRFVSNSIAFAREQKNSHPIGGSELQEGPVIHEEEDGTYEYQL